jgi:hypothetical protein
VGNNGMAPGGGGGGGANTLGGDGRLVLIFNAVDQL